MTPTTRLPTPSAASFPPPITDTPEDAARRDLAAIAHVASLLPANPDEANLAAQYVAASAQALDCQRLARAYPNDPAHMLKCFAQSASMMRQARSWRSALLLAQAGREKRGTDVAADGAAKETEQRAPGLMADALSAAPLTPTPEVPLKPDPIAEAEQYARHHRKRAILIRRLGRVPQKLDFGPLRPETVHAIVTGTTPVLRALDEKPHRSAALAA